MPSVTVENYLKTLLMEQQRASPGSEAGALVAMGRLAAAMRVAPGTATAMVKTLADSGLVDYEPRGGARLTAQGHRLAAHVLRRHRLVELFLVRVLGLEWTEVHEEAEELEHAVSEKVLERIDQLLGRPRVDPHGDPIPSATGEIDDTPRDSLATCAEGQPYRLSRVIDQDPGFLTFLEQQGLRLGVAIRVTQRRHEADAVTLAVEGAPPVVIGMQAAMKVLVSPSPTE